MKPILLILLGCWFNPLFAAPLGSNLSGLLDYAREHNPELAATRHEAEAALQRITPAAALPDPVLRTELMDITNQGTNRPVSLSPAGVGSTRYLLTQSIPWLGRRDLQREIAESRAVQANGTTSLTWHSVSAQIKSGYARYSYYSASEELTRDTLKLLNSLEKIIRSRYENGQGEQQDMVRIMIEQTEWRGEFLQLENEKHHQIARLNALLARPVMAELAAPSQSGAAPVKLDYTALLEKLRLRNPQLQIADARITEADKSRALTYNNRFPGFTLGVAPTQVGSQFNRWDLMVEFNIPLQQEARRSAEHEAESLLAANTARRESLWNQMQADLSENVQALDTAQRSVSLIETSLLPQVELGYRAALSAYELGRLDFITLLDAQRQLIKARQERLRLRLEEQLKLAEIEQLIGEE